MRYFRKSKPKQDEADWILPNNLSELDVECLKLMWQETKDKVKSIKEDGTVAFFRLLVVAMLLFQLHNRLTENTALSGYQATFMPVYLFWEFALLISLAFFLAYIGGVLRFVLGMRGISRSVSDSDKLIRQLKHDTKSQYTILSSAYIFHIQTYAKQIQSRDNLFKTLNFFYTISTVLLIATIIAVYFS